MVIYFLKNGPLICFPARSFFGVGHRFSIGVCVQVLILGVSGVGKALGVSVSRLGPCVYGDLSVSVSRRRS